MPIDVGLIVNFDVVAELRRLLSFDSLLGISQFFTGQVFNDFFFKFSIADLALPEVLKHALTLRANFSQFWGHILIRFVPVELLWQFFSTIDLMARSLLVLHLLLCVLGLPLLFVRVQFFALYGRLSD